MSFLGLENKNIVVMGVANRRSVAWSVAEKIIAAKAKPIYVFKDEELLQKNRSLIGNEAAAFVCNVESEQDMNDFAKNVAKYCNVVDGLFHSIAFANFSEGQKAFHETLKKDFLQAVDISCFSLLQAVNQLKEMLSEEASVVTMSISTTRMASENYGYMGPIKAALDSSVVFLAKSLSQEVSPRIRVNAVGASLLKTSASAGIPGYIDAYLYAEKLIPRQEALATSEVADVVSFLLSKRSSGINAQTLVVDAGMSINYFDREIMQKVTRN